MAERVIEDPVLRQRYSFTRASDEDGGEVLHIELWVDPGGGVTPHIHPAMEERFEVVEGRPELLAGKRWRQAAPGEVVTVPPGVRHAFRNRTDAVAHLRCEARPPSTLQAFLEEVAALNRSGTLTRHGLPRSPRALLEAAALVERHREMVVLLFPPLPPPAVQRRVIPALARLAERRGLRGGMAAA
jgi:quercetin dioxygenase-like cupin family protein